MNKKDFLETIVPLVQNENSKRGNPLYNSVVIAQAICETGWGASSLMMKANAIFGIKATSNWKGKVYNARTKEYYSGNVYNIVDCFRAYNTYEESIKDYFDLICNNSRYKKALYTNNPTECITAIKNGGYATSPVYINTIMSIIDNNNLRQYDKASFVGNNVEEIVVDEFTNIDEIAKDVINGKYGNGEERKQKLGSLYNEVQKRVNEILRGNTEKQEIYIVKKGDCLCNIAKKFKTTVNRIATDNGITNIDLIYVGQKLIIKR